MQPRPLNRRYIIMITASRGGPVRRFVVTRASLWSVVSLACVAVVVLLGVAVHALAIRRTAAETVHLTAENQLLAQVHDTLIADLPALRRTAQRAELSFAQLWSKSGVGIEPRMLAVGPFEAEGLVGSDGLARPVAAPVGGAVLDADPLALPLELERIAGDGTQALREVAELLEYFHAAERRLSHTPSIRPTRSIWTTSAFGRRRDPITHEWLMHKGLDLGGQIGMEIHAPADGVVIYTGRRGGYGLTVVLHHGWGLQTHFAHLNAIRVDVGDRVRRGQLIADMGNTGKSTGPHLHYEVRRWGRPLDPSRFILD